MEIQEPAMTFEQSIQRLEQIVRLLEKGDAPLESAMQLFEEGTALAAACTGMLDRAEQRVVRITKGADGAPVETEFDLGEG